MGSLNKVLLIGRLGRDPEARATAGGTNVSSFSIATDYIRNSNGTSEKQTEWHRVVAYGKLADTCTGYLHKGRLVFVEGALRTRSWEKAPGQKQYATEVVASRVTFLSPRPGTGNPLAASEPDAEPEF